MKKILIVTLACVMLTGCGNAESKETSNEETSAVTTVSTTVAEEKSDDTLIEEIEIEEIEIKEIEIEDGWVSPEYLAELEYNSMTNQW